MPLGANGPSLRVEAQLSSRAGTRFVAGIDEVGRGALAGPVSVGVVVLDMQGFSPPNAAELETDLGPWDVLRGVRDSKLLSPKARAHYADLIRAEATGFSVAHQSAQSIDAHGITAALCAAGTSALRQVEDAMGHRVDAIVLDGAHDWLSRGADARVKVLVKADVMCLTVASASVVAKTTRDRLMGEFAEMYPQYGWEKNRGYGSQAHRDAISTYGATPLHRQSWNLGLR